MKKTLIVLLALSSFLLSWKHEYHVSISQLDYNTESSTIQLSIQMHDEDVELLLDQNLDEATNLEEDKDREEVEEFLINYLNTSFKLIRDGTALELKYVGNELEHDHFWIYLETKQFSKMPSLEVENTLFLELFDDQSNMVHYSKDNQMVESTVLNKQKRKHSFQLAE